MRKYSLIVMLLLLVLSVGLTCNAQTIDSEYWEIRFDLSDEWVPIYSNPDIIHYAHKEDMDEEIEMWYESSYSVSALEDISEEQLKTKFADEYSNEKLSEKLSGNNDAQVNVTTIYEGGKYEIYASNRFYRYEKMYLAQATGFEDTYFYDTVFYTVQNNKAYYLTYDCGAVAEHFEDVTDMLNSMSFGNELAIVINDERIYPDSAPILISGRTMVPIRAVAEKLGYNVDWNAEKQLVTMTAADGTVLEFTVGADVALKNSAQHINLDVAAFIESDRTYLPLRAVAEAMNAQVEWDAENMTILIEK